MCIYLAKIDRVSKSKNQLNERRAYALYLNVSVFDGKGFFITWAKG